MDKLSLTGSRAQWINGVTLMTTFFTSRLVWGSYYCFWLFWDVWNAVRGVSLSGGRGEAGGEAKEEEQLPIPPWLALLYVTSMLALSVLNVYWFERMVETVMSRFEGNGSGKEQGKRKGDVKKDASRGKGQKHREKDLKKILPEEKRKNGSGSKEIIESTTKSK